jgi:hypothetical protein
MVGNISSYTHPWKGRAAGISDLQSISYKPGSEMYKAMLGVPRLKPIR